MPAHFEFMTADSGGISIEWGSPIWNESTEEAVHLDHRVREI